MVKRHKPLDSFLQFFSSVKCGLILLGLVGGAVVIGTLILQRPMAQEGQIEQLYAPQTIRLLAALGILDVFHTWWFLVLLGLLGANIALASIERFPQAWRFFSRPHRVAEEWFVRQLPIQREIPLTGLSPEAALATAARKLQALGHRVHPATLNQGTVYIEKHRIARLAPYVVHLSLLIIFAGAIVDGMWGYKGFISLGPGMRGQAVEPMSGNAAPRALPFTLRCDEAGMDKYPDGSPRQYWTQLAVEENGHEVLRKRIHVNEPLTYQGIRFFQSSYGSTGIPERLEIEASWPGTTRPPLTFTLRPGEQIPLGDTGYRVELGDFVPDYVMQGNQLSTRSNEPNNPAVRVQLSDAGGKTSSAWFFPKASQMNFADDSGVAFKLQNVKMGYTTGLQVAKQPGSWLIWGGCLLLSFGLFLALYVVHIRIWGVVGRDAKGRKVLVLGGQSSKYRESFEERFRQLADALDEALKKESTPVPELERLSA